MDELAHLQGPELPRPVAATEVERCRRLLEAEYPGDVEDTGSWPNMVDFAARHGFELAFARWQFMDLCCERADRADHAHRAEDAAD